METNRFFYNGGTNLHHIISLPQKTCGYVKTNVFMRVAAPQNIGSNAGTNLHKNYKGDILLTC